MVSEMAMRLWVLLTIVVIVTGRPQHQQLQEPPKPYDYQYKVENPPTNTYFGQNESGDPAGRVFGTYYVLLADGRLMNVEYFVDGDSGFVPKITFQPNSHPQQG